MSLFRTIVSGLLLILLASTAPPLAAEEDGEEYAATPTSLLELLGPEGVEGAEYDFYLSYETPASAAIVLQYRLTINATDIAFSLQSDEVERERKRYDHRIAMFSPEGEFIQSETAIEQPGYSQQSTVIRDGEIVHTERRVSLNNARAHNDQSTGHFSPLENAIPKAWLPLAFAYHIRESHKTFTIPYALRYWGDAEIIATLNTKDTGLETIDYFGEEVEAHALLIEISIELNGEFMEQTAERLWFVLPNGTIIRMPLTYNREEVIAEAITAEDAAELLGEENATENVE